MTVTVRGRRWRLEFARLKNMRGVCDSPDMQDRRIRIAKRLEGEEQLDVTLHELLHAALWDLDEEAVDETATDLARVLWKLGWRRE